MYNVDQNVLINQFHKISLVENELKKFHKS
jgi:hypothetical protein